jgi:transposase
MDPQSTALCPEWQPLANGAGRTRTLAAAAGLHLQRVNREDIVFIPVCLAELLPPEHLARQLWRLVDEVLDLSAFYAARVVREGQRGRPAIDPKILVALWLFATMQGVQAARDVARLCVEHLAYIWLCGGVAVSDHTLSDFRVQHVDALDALLTWVVQTMAVAGLVDWQLVAHDGMRVRASAGGGSFHRQPTLAAHLAQAQAQRTAAEATQQAPETDTAPRACTRAGRAARVRAAQGRVARLQQALAELPAAEAAKVRNGQPRDQARVSSTDPQARVMKMADGGFRPAYNWQLASDSLCDVIVGVAVSAIGGDQALLVPMLEEILHRYGHLPRYWAVDGGFLKLEVLEAWDTQVTILSPTPKPKDAAREAQRYVPLPTDSPAVAAWRTRMGTDEAKVLYQQRAAIAELSNAQARTENGVQQSVVRGLIKVWCTALWMALAHNLRIWLRQAFASPSPAASSAVVEGGTQSL